MVIKANGDYIDRSLSRFRKMLQSVAGQVLFTYPPDRGPTDRITGEMLIRFLNHVEWHIRDLRVECDQAIRERDKERLLRGNQAGEVDDLMHEVWRLRSALRGEGRSLLPCPNPVCLGGPEVMEWGRFLKVSCGACGMHGPEADDEWAAVEAWNALPRRPERADD